MKKLFLLPVLALGAFVLLSLMPEKELRSNESGDFYYCYIKGYYNGDPDKVGYYFSSIEEYSSKPSTSCTGWKEHAERNLKNFTAICDSYRLYGPFGVGSEVGIHRTNKMRQFEEVGEVWQSNKGPRK